MRQAQCALTGGLKKLATTATSRHRTASVYPSSTAACTEAFLLSEKRSTLPRWGGGAVDRAADHSNPSRSAHPARALHAWLLPDRRCPACCCGNHCG